MTKPNYTRPGRALITALTLSTLAAMSPALAHEGDDPLVFGLDTELERGFSNDGHGNSWDVEATLGYDARKLVLTTEGDFDGSDIHGSEVQLLYQQAISAYWDVRVGVRKDFDPAPRPTWGVLTLTGVAPFFIDTELSLFVGESGLTEWGAEFEYEMYLTKSLMLTPYVEAVGYGKDDEELGVGSGLAEVEAGFHLGYQIASKVEPYIGVAWTKVYGGTADIVRAEGDDTSATTLLLGIKAWY